MKSLAAILFAVAILTGQLCAAGVEADFAAANKLYAEGKFADSAKAYDALLQNGTRSTALLFNDANAHFKAGQLGQAIAGYREAAELSPRNAEIKANLGFVRKQVQGVTIPQNQWLNGLSFFSVNEWTIITVVAFWLTFILLIVRQLRPALAITLKRVTVYAGILTVGCGAVLAVAATNHLSSASAVVLTNEATARSGPFDEAQSVFTAHDGAELPVLSRHEDWVQVTDGAKIGWLPVRSVAVLAGA